MTGRNWRLLAASILLLVAAKFLRGQGAVADRSSDFASEPVQLRASLVANSLYVSGVDTKVPISTGAPEFRRIVRSAGIIFSGRVVSIGRGLSISGGDRLPSATISFRVEHAIRGAYPGQELTIHEWAGLWDRGERYRVGERVFLFLYAPGKLGLSSPVAGTAGRFAMNERDEIVLDALHARVFAANPATVGRASVPYAQFARIVRLSSGEK
jgi:hypothetical protein